MLSLVSVADKFRQHNYQRAAFNAGIVLFLGFICISGQSAAAEGGLSSTRQIKSMSPAQADAHIKGDLAAVLGPADKRDWPRLTRLLHVTMPTRPYGTPFGGLCRRDLLDLKYAPKSEAGGFSDQPLRPYGIEARAQFHAMQAPLVSTPQQPSMTYVSAPSCLSLAQNGAAGWFDAPSTESAAQAVNILGATLDRVKSGTLLPSSCNISPDLGSCQDKAFKGVSVSSLVQFTACEPATESFCYKYFFPSKIVLTVAGHKPADGVSAGAVSSLAVGTYATVD